MSADFHCGINVSSWSEPSQALVLCASEFCRQFVCAEEAYFQFNPDKRGMGLVLLPKPAWPFCRDASDDEARPQCLRNFVDSQQLRERSALTEGTSFNQIKLGDKLGVIYKMPLLR